MNLDQMTPDELRILADEKERRIEADKNKNKKQLTEPMFLAEDVIDCIRRHFDNASYSIHSSGSGLCSEMEIVELVEGIKEAAKDILMGKKYYVPKGTAMVKMPDSYGYWQIYDPEEEVIGAGRQVLAHEDIIGQYLK